RYLRPLSQLIEMFSVAAWLYVQVGIVARCGNAVHRRVFLLLLHLLEAFEDLMGDQITLLDPAFLAAGGANFRKPLFPIEHINSVPVFRGADFLVNRR